MELKNQNTLIIEMKLLELRAHINHQPKKEISAFEIAWLYCLQIDDIFI